jgi:hypothetical protein
MLKSETTKNSQRKSAKKLKTTEDQLKNGLTFEKIFTPKELDEAADLERCLSPTHSLASAFPSRQPTPIPADDLSNKKINSQKNNKLTTEERLKNLEGSMNGTSEEIEEIKGIFMQVCQKQDIGNIGKDLNKSPSSTVSKTIFQNVGNDPNQQSRS